ncbi:hypothetical protein CFIMG_005489RA [Ceratocystis fimbriata CBS 114723]|uniref:Uncharacterized protein n=1 Tax=Ceratocystis fimbriata CBS 114723 TaxID=1035309 RepID=A0A2C5WZY1_9PEZI|nr:hypothetical protein CFIMG_005489RA [Ceratocystis fimbriata CBS 114723]
MPAFDEPLITDWTSPLYKLKQTWAACGNDVNSISLACHENHGKPVAIQCRDCHGAIVDRIHRVFQSPPVDAWFSNRPAFLAELDDMFARARTYDLDMQAISNRIKAEKIQWYRDMVTQYPLLIAVLESTHSSDHVARLLGSDHEMAAPSPPPGQPPPPVEFDFGVLSEAVALAIGPPQDRNIGPTEVNQYAALRRASEDEAAKKVAIEFFFRRPGTALSNKPGDVEDGTSTTKASPESGTIGPPTKETASSLSTSTPITTVPPAILSTSSQPIPGTERYAQIYQDSNISIERLMSMIEADLRRTSSNTTPTTHLHGPPDRRRALGLGTATPLTPEQRQRVDQLVRIIDAQGKRTAEIAAMRTRMAELQRAKRANEEDAARKKREKVAAEEKRRVEAIQAAEAEVKAKAAALSSGDKMDIDDPNKIPTSMYDIQPCSSCTTPVDPKLGQSLGCAICVLGTLSGRVAKQTLYCSETCYNKGHEPHVKDAHPCESGSSCIRLAPGPTTPSLTGPGPSPTTNGPTTAASPASGGTAAPPTPTGCSTATTTTSTTQPNGALDSTTAVACLMCDVRLKRNSFFCCLACAKSNKDAHIANFHRDAFADGRGMPKTLVLEDFLAKRLDMFVKGAKMEFAGKR